MRANTADEDIGHAVRIPFRHVPQGRDRLLIIGPDPQRRLLEIVVIDPGGDPAVIHAAPLRRKSYAYL